MKTSLAAMIVLLFCVNFISAQQIERLVVHEWGTFTSLQDETGRAIGGINSDDEPVPLFVHRLRWDSIQSVPSFSQGVPRCFPDATMRLETPVIYFHLPKGASPKTVDVTATFNGGWLTEFYPDAAVTASGYTAGGAPGKLTADSVGTLKWTGVKIGTEGPLEKTDDHVWVTPRNVDADMVSITNSQSKPESEKYLFYRGVAHLDAPLRIRAIKNKLNIEPQLTPDAHIGIMSIRHMWQYQMRDDGKCAFNVLKPMNVITGARPGNNEIPATFDESRFSTENLDKLKQAMHQALVADGLFPDEADALLGTWELSYFKSSGMRILFLVPRPWTDRYLPLKISGTTTLVRTMVGRIELITPIERDGLRQIGLSNDPKEQDRAYEKLGRFRNGLVLDEQKRNPSPALAQFISRRGLQGFGE